MALDPTKSRAALEGLQAAADALNAGRARDARQALKSIIADAPDHPIALYLLGGCARVEGDHVEAERLYRHSLEIDPSQLQVRFALGKALAARGALALAADEFKKAVDAEPRYLAAYLELGAVRLGLGELDEAEQAFRAALALKPGSAAASVGMARIDLARDDIDRAAARLEETLQRSPKNAPARFYLARARRLSGDAASARALLSAAIDAGSRSTEYLQEGARASFEDGAADGAIDLLRNAIDIAPQSINLHRDLAQILHMTGKGDPLKSFETAIDDGAGGEALRAAYAAVAIAVADPERARSRIGDAGGGAALRDARGRLQLSAGEARAALNEFEEALAAAPSDAFIAQNVAAAALEVGDPQKARDICAAYLERSPADQAFLAYFVTAQKMLGDPLADQLADTSRFTRLIDVEPPEGFGSIAEFNRVLLEELNGLHRASRQPIDQSLRGGTQVELSAIARRSPIIGALAAQLKHAVASFASSLRPDPEHPFLSRIPDEISFSGLWSVKLRSSGSHVSHIHPEGWLSSAYYVSLPPCVPGAQDRSGWFYLHKPPMPTAPAVAPVPIEPKEGALFLFPSYFWHGVNPFVSEEPRVTVAFDVRPRK